VASVFHKTGFIWVRLFLLGDIIIIEQSFSRIQKSLALVFWRDIRELMA